MSDEGGYSRSAESKITFLDAITALKEDRGTILGEKLALEKEVAELRVQLADALKKLSSAAGVVEAQNKRVKMLEVALLTERRHSEELSNRIEGLSEQKKSPQNGDKEIGDHDDVTLLEAREDERGEEEGEGYSSVGTEDEGEGDHTTVEFGDGTILEYSGGQYHVVERKEEKEKNTLLQTFCVDVLMPLSPHRDLDSLDSLASLVTRSEWAISHTLRSHFDVVTSATFIEEGKLLSASEDAVIRLWDLTNTKKDVMIDESEFTYRGHTGAVLALTSSPDRTQFFSGGEDGLVHVWKWDSKRKTPYESYGTATPFQKALLKGHSDAVWTLAHHPRDNLLLSGSADGTIIVWRTEEEMSRATSFAVSSLLHRDGHSGSRPPSLLTPSTVFLSFDIRNPSRAFGATCSGDFFLFDLNKCETIFHKALATDVAQETAGTALECVALHPILPLAYCAMGDGKLKCIDAAQGGLVQEESAHEGASIALDMHSSGMVLASSGTDGVVRLWDTSSMHPFQNIEWTSSKGEETASALCFDSFGAKGRLVIGGGDGDISVYSS